jgi:hypothetical protein
MSSSEILAELPKLKVEERQQLFERLCELQDQDLIEGVGPTDAERQILDEALAEYERDGDHGTPWREAIRGIRTPKAS